jgi:hypothetical protein
MALKITRASDPIPVDRLNMVLYGPPGLGKTSLAFTAEAPLLLDFDNGSHRAANRKDVVRVSAWGDVASMTAEDLEQFKTVIVDTAGRALDALSVDIIRANPKHGRGGALTLQGFGELKARFGAFLKLLNSFGKDVVLIAHMDEQRSGDDVIERLDVQGGSKGEIYKSADAMGRLVLAGKQRQLLFSPTDAAFGKNPGQLPPLDIPSPDRPEFAAFLAGVIQQTKDRLNAATEAQKLAQEEQDWWATHLPEVRDANGLNALLGRIAAAPKAVKIMVRDRARQIGADYDEDLKAFVPAKVKEAA